MAKKLFLPLEPRDRRLTFELFRKEGRFGDVLVDHLWLPLPGLYGRGGNRYAGNHLALCHAFWDLCRQAGSDGEGDVRESYLLARMSPFGRTVGSGKIFHDGRLGRVPAPDGGEVGLNDLLTADVSASIEEAEFHLRTAKILGPPELGAEVIEEYQAFCAEWLGPAAERLNDDEEAAVELASSHWQDQMRRFGRRAGHAVRKRVLDVLSYESRAAVHRCYSAVWSEMFVPYLRMKGLSTTTIRFLEFWHTEPVRPAGPQAESYFHVFHGHVFGLHPAGAAFIQTPAGQQLLGDWLSAADGPPDGVRYRRGHHAVVAEAYRRLQIDRDERAAYGRLLQGLLLAVHHYAGERWGRAQDRALRPGPVDPQQLDRAGDAAASRGRRRQPARRDEPGDDG